MVAVALSAFLCACVAEREDQLVIDLQREEGMEEFPRRMNLALDESKVRVGAWVDLLEVLCDHLRVTNRELGVLDAPGVQAIKKASIFRLGM